MVGKASGLAATLAISPRLSVFACGLFVCLSSSAAPITQLDDLGRKVEIAAPAKRIVTLAPFLTELAFSVGVGDRIVGVSEHSDYPEAAKRLPQVASSAGISIESVAALQPDLVLAWQDTMRPADLERFAALRIPVFVAKPLSILDVGRLYGTIEQLSGVRSPEPLRQFHEKLRRSLHKLDKPAVKVFLEVWHQPLTTIAGPHWMNEALAFCGATNAFQD